MKNLLKRNYFLVFSLIAIFGFSIVSCSKKDDEEVAKGKAKFEVTGDYKGKLVVLYTFSSSNTGESTSENISSLPWSKEKDYNGQLAMGMSALTDVSGDNYLGSPGQKVIINMYVDSKLVKSATTTAGADGTINTSTIAYTK